MEFALSQAVASGDALEHRPPECGHCVQNFLADLDLRDLPGEAARFELGAGPAPDRPGAPGHAPDAVPILVVDDDPETLRHLRDTLAEAGYAPLVTGDPKRVRASSGPKSPNWSCST